ncbi:MAG TPA: hypothetical protein VNX25_04225 [Verrucomicrobiae bacterium]|nr:hypothetical protein [Verrucomicrobiae bacterium]
MKDFSRQSARGGRFLAAPLPVLLIGLAAAGGIYLSAGEEAPGPLDDFTASKAYHRALEVNGGKLTIVADELSRGFDDLWHGKGLACVVAALSVAAAGVLAAVGPSPDTTVEAEAKPEE